LKKKFAQIISKNTGLKSEDDIEAYTYFVQNANFDNGLILYSGVEHEFYHELYKKASEPMKTLEGAYHAAIRSNSEALSFIHCKIKSPLAKQARQEFAKYYHKFMELGLISPPEISKIDDSYYPRLRGYNYYNDDKVYVAYKKKGEKEFTGRMHIDAFKGQNKEQRLKYDFLNHQI